MDFKEGLRKIVHVFEEEEIPYMIVGGFAMSYYNRFRFTADIDCVIQIYPNHVDNILKHFPDWIPFSKEMQDSASKAQLFNITDFASGVKYDLMPYVDSDYNWTAFGRKKKVEFMGVDCFIASPEDLIIAKLRWYTISQSAKQLEDIKFLLKEVTLNQQYLEVWVNRLNLLRYGLF